MACIRTRTLACASPYHSGGPAVCRPLLEVSLRHGNTRRVGRHGLRRLDVPQAGSIQTEHLGLDLVGELRVAVALDKLIRNTELAEGLDLPLRVPPQYGVRPPQHRVRPQVTQQRPENMRTLER